MLQRKPVRIVSTLVLSLSLVFLSAIPVGALTAKDITITKLQTFLQSKGFLVIPKGDTKGSFGPATKQALIKYQKSVGLSAQGVFGTKTKATIAAELSGASRPVSANGTTTQESTQLATSSAAFSSSTTTQTLANADQPVTEASLNARLQAIYRQIALSQHIDQLKNTTITGGTISGTSISGLSTNSIGEGTNLYYTDGRTDARLSATSSLPNIRTLSGLTSIGSSGATTTFNGNVTIGTTVINSGQGVNVLGKGAKCDGVADDTAAIQLALNGAGRIIFPAGANCNVSSALKIYSNTWLDAGTATLTYTGGTGNMLVSRAAVTPNRIVTDAAMTAGSATLTSATAAFTSADVGRSVTVAGANAGGVILCVIITAVTNGTTATVALPAGTTITGATATIYDRDSNIEISGGTWVRGNAGGVGNLAHALFLRRIDGLRIHDFNGTSTPGGKYMIEIGDCTKVNAQRLIFNTASDGIHIDGPASDVTIRDVSGSTGDDTVAFTGGVYGAYVDLVGNISGAVVDGVNSYTPFQMVKFVGGTGATIRDVVVRNVTGRGSGGGVNLPDDTAFSGNSDISNVLIENVRGSFTGGSVLLDAVLGGDVTIRNITTVAKGISVTGSSTWRSVIIDGVTGSGTASTYAFNSTGTITSLSISNVNLSLSATANGYLIVTGNATNVSLQNIQADYAAGAYGAVLLLNGTTDNASVSGIKSNFAGSGTLAFNAIEVSGTVTNLWVNNASLVCTGTTTQGVGLRIDGTGILSHYALSNVRATSGLGLLFYSPSSTIGQGEITNTYLKSINRMAQFYTAADVALTNVTVDTPSNAVIYTSGATVTVRGSGINRIGGWAGFQRNASEVIHCINMDYPADASLLTRAIGDRCYNTNAALGTLGAAGPIISDATQWHLMSNPTLVY